MSELSGAGRAEEARAMADEALTLARATGNPRWIASVLRGRGLAFADVDPVRALEFFRQAISYGQEHRLLLFVSIAKANAVPLEIAHGDLDDGLVLFDDIIDSFHQAGNLSHLTFTLLDLVVVFDRLQRHDAATTLYGTTTHLDSALRPRALPDAVGHLRTVLGAQRFDACVAAGAAMEVSDAVRYARGQIQRFRSELAGSSANLS